MPNAKMVFFYCKTTDNMYFQPFYVDRFSQIIVMCVAKKTPKTTMACGKMRVRLTKIAADLHWRGGIVAKPSNDYRKIIW